MKFHSLNIPTVLEALPSSKVLIFYITLDMVFLQETMCLGSIMLKILNFFSLDANSLSGGLLRGWNTSFNAFSTSFLHVVIILKGESK